MPFCENLDEFDRSKPRDVIGIIIALIIFPVFGGLIATVLILAAMLLADKLQLHVAFLGGTVVWVLLFFGGLYLAIHEKFKKQT